MKISFFIPETYNLPIIGYNYAKMPASAWIRCLQLIPYLEKAGVSVLVNKVNANCDTAIFLRRWSEKDYLIAKQLKENGTKIVLDTPVNYFSDEKHPAFTEETKSLFRKFVNLADKIICASDNIANFAKNLGYNAVCIEDSIDMEKIVRNQKKTTDLIWAGTAEKAEILNFLMPVINKNNWTLTLIAEKRPNLKGDFIFKKWKYSTFFEELSKGIVGIFPRNCDNDYDRGHSLYKTGVFIASHVPVIYSPVPEYAKIATPGNSIQIENLDPKEWEHQIKQVVSKKWIPDFTKNPIDKYTCTTIAEKYTEI
jgi:hypothetical protein